MKADNNEVIIKKPLVWLEIRKMNLLYNIKQIKKLSKNSKIMAVLKADAYGLGCVGVATAIEKEIDAFGVVGINDALELREAGIAKPVINMGIYSPDDTEKLLEKEINPTIFTYVDSKNFDNAAKKKKITGGVWIKVDTGLNRLGISYQEAMSFIKSVKNSKNLKINGVYSTLSEDTKLDKIQLERFIIIKKECRKNNIQIPIWSLASSQAVFLFPESNLDMVRIGIPILGYYPSPEAKKLNLANLMPATNFKTKIACIKKVKKEESVSYKKKFTAKKDALIAVLLAGYSYGLDSSVTKNGKILIQGKKYRYAGSPTVVNSFINIKSDSNIQRGDEVVIFGEQKGAKIELEKVCAWSNQSVYEFLSRIPKKVQRFYV